MDKIEAELLSRAAQGDQQALGSLIDAYRDRLKRMVTARIDPRLAARIDPSDVVQEVQVEASLRLSDYIKQPDVSFLTWLRFLAKQRLVEIARRNIYTQARDVRREQILNQDWLSGSSAAIASCFAANIETPSKLVAQAELHHLMEQAIEKLEAIDREILVLRHIELLDNQEAAEELQISTSTCRKRHFRALQRLKDVLSSIEIEWKPS